MQDKIRVFLVTQNGTSCFFRSIDIETLFDGADVGDTITIQLREMTETEYEALPEFEDF